MRRGQNYSSDLFSERTFFIAPLFPAHGSVCFNVFVKIKIIEMMLCLIYVYLMSDVCSKSDLRHYYNALHKLSKHRRRLELITRWCDSTKMSQYQSEKKLNHFFFIFCKESILGSNGWIKYVQREPRHR